MASLSNEQDWNEWLAEHASRFLLFARQQTRSGQDAEDVLQDALVEAWKRVGGRPDNALVYATIHRRAIDLGRRTERRTRREQASDQPQLFIPSDEDDEAARLLEKELQRLPLQQREVLTLKFWGGLTFAEVAVALDIPPGTAASRYRLALDTLRQTLTTTLA
ncbi:RNA polymerase sigma factor [Luteolibacter luteus]|uniref:Sigma-70 family RNA polymerase sigma factor n=1 Tax=Luteolibacter luteus TaxID=2728835 RepID=A0A858RPQ2_9BACT|nr:sigma-70 family RNA polymerase sigma factor [Luteolibacter luteus]QJE98601.1 sigma-70 family RNA polymerase sigma factor [Luteolibacter luteus]